MGAEKGLYVSISSNASSPVSKGLSCEDKTGVDRDAAPHRHGKLLAGSNERRRGKYKKKELQERVIKA